MNYLIMARLEGFTAETRFAITLEHDWESEGKLECRIGLSRNFGPIVYNYVTETESLTEYTKRIQRLIHQSVG